MASLVLASCLSLPHPLLKYSTPSSPLHIIPSQLPSSSPLFTYHHHHLLCRDNHRTSTTMGSLGPDFSSSPPPPPHSSAAPFRPLDPEEFRQHAHRTVDYIADYYKTVEKRPVLSRVDPGYLLSELAAPSYEGAGLEAALEDVGKYVLPGLTHWVSPNFFGFFPATVSTAAFVGEMLCAGFNCVGFNWVASPAATEVEMVVMDWVADMLKLPPSFMFSGTGGGVLHGTTSEAIICTLVAARDRALASLRSPSSDDDDNDDHDHRDYMSKFVVYASDQTHSTFHKACTLVGILPRNIRLLPTSSSSSFSLSPSALRSALSSDAAAGLVPLYLCTTVGTTSTTAVDPLPALLAATEPHRSTLWIHVDAAYAGAACICPEFRHHLDGVEQIDSLSLAPHKWLLTGLDCCCLWVKSPESLTKSLGTRPEYLKNELSESNTVVDYKDWQIGTGRRFRALRLWLVIRSYGVRKLQEHIRSDVRMARVFEGMVRSDDRFEVTAPVPFGLVCFRLRRKEEVNRELLERVNQTGRVYMTHTVAGGVYMLRFAVGSTLTEERHVVAAWKVIQEKADTVLAPKNELS